MNNFYDLVMTRESCRNFDPSKKVTKSQLEEIITCGRMAPSACNSQPWHFYAVVNQEILPKFAQCVQDMGMNKFADNAQALIIVVEEKATLAEKFTGRIKDQLFAPLDLGIAVSHICLAATDIGLSTCIMGWLNEEKMSKLLDLPKGKRIRVVIGVGYSADEKTREKKRKPAQETITYIE